MRYIFIYFLFIFSYPLLAQEVCNNGIDDDGNGLIDCYDPHCAGGGPCASFFYGSVNSCTFIPSVGPFGALESWRSTVVTSTRSMVLVGDVDNDGVPEAIAHGGTAANQLYIFNGVTGALKVTINCPEINDLSNAIAIGDVDRDGLAEIYVVTRTSLLYCFEPNGTARAGFTPISIPASVGGDEATPNLTDFNGDGIAEIYIGFNIYNSLTGALIASAGTGSSAYNIGFDVRLPVAADVLPGSFCPYCDGSELVCGNTVYAVDIASGSIIAQPNSLPSSLEDGYTSVADMDLDSALDVVVTTDGIVYVWNPRTGQQMGNTYILPNSTGIGGRPNIADYDNDGVPEIGVGARSRYVAINFDTATFTLSQLWVNTTNDASQGTTGTSFDFEGDGFAEVIYRDEDTLYVWDGATGKTKMAVACASGTRSEFPTIADVDGDGQADIICNCSNNLGGPVSGNRGNLRVYHSNSGHWIAARKVFNQHAYNVTNINDDLTIPAEQQSNARLRHLNNFLCQAPVVTVNWKPIYVPVPDLTINIDSFKLCYPADSMTVSVSVCNRGSARLHTQVPVTFYSGDPHGGAAVISTQIFRALPVDTGSCSHTNFVMPWAGSPVNLYAVVNDLGTNPRLSPQLAMSECDTSNNFFNLNIVPVSVKPGMSGLDSVYCTLNMSFPLTGTPAGGVFSGPGITGNSFNPFNAGVGTHTITYSLPAGCKADTSVTVTVLKVPVVDAGIYGSLCLIDSSVQLIFTPAGGIWTGMGITDSVAGIFNPVKAGTGNFNLVYTYNNRNNGCSDADSIRYTVFPLPAADAGAGATICPGDSVRLVATGGVTYQWFPATGLSNAGIFNPVTTPATTTRYTVVVKDNNHCQAVDSVTIQVLDAPVAAFTVQNACLGDSVTIIDRSQPAGNLSYWWSMGDGVTFNAPLSAYKYNAHGTYTVTEVVSLGSCSDTAWEQVNVSPIPLVDFTGNPQPGDDAGPVSFQANGKNVLHWQWSFGDGAFSNEANPSHTYADSGWYDVLLVGTGSGGCADSVLKAWYIQALSQLSVFIPNAFTPNGDGQNDVFYIYGTGIKKIICTIFNRYGEVVFSSDEMLTSGWDGIYKNGMVPPAVYVYEVHAVFSTNEVRKMVGTLTVVR